MKTLEKPAADGRYRDVVVFLEPGAETINSVLLAEGSRIALLLGGDLYAISDDVEPKTLSTELARRPFRLMLFAHSDRGRELAPRVAWNFGVAAVTDCFDIRFRKEKLYYARYVYGGQFEQEVSFAKPPEFASISLSSLEVPRAKISPLKVNEICFPQASIKPAKTTIRILPPDFRTVDIRHAKRILDIGAGCDQPALMRLAETLGLLLEASIGATRPVVDNGSIPKARMIGETGETVAPELTLALGVSGSPHHMAGIQRSGKILAVNCDPSAPIFGACDHGFVADLRELLPKLLYRIEQYKDRGLL